MDLISKKLEVMIERLWTLNPEELERLSNEIEAEIQFRDTNNRIRELDGWRTNEGGDATKGG